jgi:hypothetical protein
MASAGGSICATSGEFPTMRLTSNTADDQGSRAE